MRLFILGATGGTGRALLREGLEHSHDLTAFVRSPQKISYSHPRLEVLAGDPLNSKQLTAALPGHDAILSAFGPRTLRRTTIGQEFGQTLITSLKHAGLRRVIVVSSALLFPDAGILAFLLGHTIFRDAIRDSAEMERRIQLSELDWTIVRPPRRSLRVAFPALTPGRDQSIPPQSPPDASGYI
jgi:putative NADH-flavin reductase